MAEPWAPRLAGAWMAASRASRVSRAGPHGYEHGWIFVGAPGMSTAESVTHAHRETGPRVGKESIGKGAPEMADLVEKHGHANFAENSPHTGRTVAELKKRGITAETQPVKVFGEKRVHVYDVAQRRPAGENGPPGDEHMVLPGRAARVADRIMASMATVSSPSSGFTEGDLRGAQRELMARLHSGSGDAATIRLRLKAIRAALRARGAG